MFQTNEKVKKSNRLAKQKKTFARMSRFFVHFLSFFAQLRGETSSSGAMEEVNTTLWNSTAGKLSA